MQGEAVVLSTNVAAPSLQRLQVGQDRVDALDLGPKVGVAGQAEHHMPTGRLARFEGQGQDLHDSVFRSPPQAAPSAGEAARRARASRSRAEPLQYCSQQPERPH